MDTKEIEKVPAVAPEKLTVETVKKWIAPLATDQEAMMFVALCRHQGLDPFVKDAYLIKYSSTAPATVVVSKDLYLKRANHLPEYDGMRAGIIVRPGPADGVQYREGAALMIGETLLGGWAEVHRKDRKLPMRAEVDIREYAADTRPWKKMPATMIRKVAVVQALREAFPDQYQGLYDEAEMGAVEVPEIKPEIAAPGPAVDKEIPAPTAPTAAPEKQYLLPDDIEATTLCDLGKFRTKPKAYGEIPLSSLLVLRSKAENPAALDRVIGYLIDPMLNLRISELAALSTDEKIALVQEQKKEVK